MKKKGNLPDNKKANAPRSSRRRRRSTVKRTLLVLCAIFAVSILFAFLLIQSAYDIFGLNKPDQQIEINIPTGMSSGQIASLLGEKGVIEQPMVFRLYASIRDKSTTFQAGDYILNSKMGYDEIILALKTGDTIKNEVTITFPEGLTIRDIAKLLEKNEVCSADEFIACLDETDFGYEFEDLLGENELRFHKLEGYLFPDTYDFYVGENVRSVANKFLKNFSNRIMPELYEKILDSGMTLNEAVTLASIIQKEASVESEMNTVSSVFHNRLALPSVYPNLQSDVTINYVEYDIKPLQSRSTQEIYDAYNTYVCAGLPVGPICSPGLAAIEAAIAPEDTGYYFFVTDVNGVYYYSETADEHYANVRKAFAVQPAEGSSVETHGTGVS